MQSSDIAIVKNPWFGDWRFENMFQSSNNDVSSWLQVLFVFLNFANTKQYLVEIQFQDYISRVNGKFYKEECEEEVGVDDEDANKLVRKKRMLMSMKKKSYELNFLSLGYVT